MRGPRPAFRVRLPIRPAIEICACCKKFLLLARPAVKVASTDSQESLYLGHRVGECFERRWQQNHIANAREETPIHHNGIRELILGVINSPDVAARPVGAVMASQPQSEGQRLISVEVSLRLVNRVAGRSAFVHLRRGPVSFIKKATTTVLGKPQGQQVERFWRKPITARSVSRPSEISTVPLPVPVPLERKVSHRFTQKKIRPALWRPVASSECRSRSSRRSASLFGGRWRGRERG